MRSWKSLLFWIAASTAFLPASAQESDRLKNVSFSTKGKIILMPCTDKSGNQMMGSGSTNDFCTETFNQLVRDGGARTISWFKVNSALKKTIDAQNSTTSNPFFSSSSTGKDYASDSYIPELIKTGKLLGAKYIIRPVILNKDSTQSQDMKVRTGFMGIGAGVSSVSETNSSATVKIDVISVAEEDIVGSRSFSGSVSSKKSGGFGSQTNAYSAAYGGMDAPTRAAVTEAIYKSVEYISERMN